MHRKIWSLWRVAVAVRSTGGGAHRFCCCRARSPVCFSVGRPDRGWGQGTRVDRQCRDLELLPVTGSRSTRLVACRYISASGPSPLPQHPQILPIVTCGSATCEGTEGDQHGDQPWTRCCCCFTPFLLSLHPASRGPSSTPSPDDASLFYQFLPGSSAYMTAAERPLLCALTSSSFAVVSILVIAGT